MAGQKAVYSQDELETMNVEGLHEWAAQLGVAGLPPNANKAKLVQAIGKKYKDTAYPKTFLDALAQHDAEMLRNIAEHKGMPHAGVRPDLLAGQVEQEQTRLGQTP